MDTQAQEGGRPKPPPEEVRLRMQAEMTLLVWVRTSLALMGVGFVVARFGLFLRELAEVGHLPLRHDPRFSLVLGNVFIGLGVLMLVLAVALYQRFLRRLARGELGYPSEWSLGVLLALTLAGLGVVLATYLAIERL